VKADIFFVCCVLYGLIFGLRRGFYKELIVLIALVVGVGVARAFNATAGEFLHDKGVPGPIAHVMGPVFVWVVVFFLVNLIGRLVLKKARDPDAENRIEAAAGKAADLVEGDTKAGPMTLLTNPIAHAQRSFVYWSDKLLGGALGVVKGATAAYACFAIIYVAEMHLAADPLGMRQAISESRAKEVYVDYLAWIMEKVPEYRLVENVASTEKLADETKGEPQVVDRLALDNAWAQVKATTAFQRLANDPEIKALWAKTIDGKRDLKTLLTSPKVRELIADPEFVEAFANTDVNSVRNALVGKSKDAPAPK
jgi:hypothetical protein